MKRKTKKTIQAYVISVVFGFVMVYPLIWMFFATFKGNKELFSTTALLPPSYSLDAYLRRWKGSGQYAFITFFINSFKMVIPAMFFTIVSCSIVACGFARFKFVGRKLLFGLMVSTLTFPNTTTIIPRYLLFRNPGWPNTFEPFWMLVLLIACPFFIFMLAQSLRGIPKDPDESARIGEANSFVIFKSTPLPLMKPTLFPIGPIRFVWIWNDFYNPLIYINSVKNYPPALGVRMVPDTSGIVYWSQVLAMALVSMLPLIILFFLAQRRFIGGIVATGMKGQDMMKYEKNCVKDVKIVYIERGPRGWVWEFVSDLSLEESISGTVFLYGIDLFSAKANEIIGNRTVRMEEARSQWNYVVSEDIDSALEGADFVIISIISGTILSFKEMRSDVYTPEKCGIYQSAGDTVGPGGLFRAMHVLPMCEGSADKIREHCPDIWVVNHTNFMTLCTRILYKRFPLIKAFGCHHEMFRTQKVPAYTLKEFCGIMMDRRMIKTNVLGINHFTWIDRAEYQGRNLFPLYEKLVEKYGEIGLGGVEKNHWANKGFTSGSRVKSNLFKGYGLIAAAGDRHLAEFYSPWYLRNPEAVASWGSILTAVDKRKQMLGERLKRSRVFVSGEEAFKFQVTGEDDVYQIKALFGLEDFMCNVSLPNTGQIQGLLKGAVVENNAFLARNRIIPVQAERLPDPVNILVLKHVVNQEMILKICVDRDYRQAFQAFYNDPLMTPGVGTARTLFCEMIDHTEEFSPDYRW